MMQCGRAKLVSKCANAAASVGVIKYFRKAVIVILAIGITGLATVST